MSMRDLALAAFAALAPALPVHGQVTLNASSWVPPTHPITANMLIGSVLVVVAAVACLMLIGAGIPVFIAAATAATLSAGVLVLALLLEQTPAGYGPGAAAVALGLIAALPRTTIWLAKLPLPSVPGTAEELKEEEDFPDFDVI
jgi:hypothetical protein